MKENGDYSPESALSSGVEALDRILDGGYPRASSVMVSGPPGIGKEALGYWFLRSGLLRGDFCFYVTHRPVADVLRNMQAFGIVTNQLPEFMASIGSQKRCTLADPTSISFEIKSVIQLNKNRCMRIVTDILSPLLVLNSTESMYRYWSQLLADAKNYDTVFMAYAEEAMHTQSTFASMEQIFDCLIEMKVYEQGLLLTPLLRVKKMLGLPPIEGYFKFSFGRNRMEIVVANVPH